MHLPARLPGFSRFSFLLGRPNEAEAPGPLLPKSISPISFAIIDFSPLEGRKDLAGTEKTARGSVLILKSLDSMCLVSAGVLGEMHF